MAPDPSEQPWTQAMPPDSSSAVRPASASAGGASSSSSPHPSDPSGAPPQGSSLGARLPRRLPDAPPEGQRTGAALARFCEGVVNVTSLAFHVSGKVSEQFPPHMTATAHVTQCIISKTLLTI